MENNSGKISVALGGIAVVGAVVLTTCSVVLSAPLVVVVIGGCAIVGLASGSIYAGISYLKKNNEVSENSYRANDTDTEERTALLQHKQEHTIKSNQISKLRLEEKKASFSKKKMVSEEAKKEAREALYQSAQLLQLDQNTKNLAFNNYLKAAELGEEESLVSLEILADEMSSESQLKLSEFYGKFLKNNEKASYWREKGIEKEGINLKNSR